MPDFTDDEKSPNVESMLQRLQEIWERNQRGETISSNVESELRSAIAALYRRVERLELKIAQLPSYVFNDPRR